jgi:hypothetical protein
MSCSGTRPIRPLGCLPLRTSCPLVCIPWALPRADCTFTCLQVCLQLNRWTECSPEDCNHPQRDGLCDCGGSHTTHASLITRRIGQYTISLLARGHPSRQLSDAMRTCPPLSPYRFVGEGSTAKAVYRTMYIDPSTPSVYQPHNQLRAQRSSRWRPISQSRQLPIATQACRFLAISSSPSSCTTPHELIRGRK